MVVVPVVEAVDRSRRGLSRSSRSEWPSRLSERAESVPGHMSVRAGGLTDFHHLGFNTLEAAPRPGITTSPTPRLRLGKRKVRTREAGGMDFSLDPEARQIRDVVAEFVDEEVVPVAGDIDHHVPDLAGLGVQA